MIKGLGTKRAVPYICEVDRGEDIPTIFWLLPKNMKGTYETLSLFQSANTGVRRNNTINPNKMYEGDVQDFRGFCIKVENYQFSEDYPDLHEKGVMSIIEDKDILGLMVSDLDPQIFQEVQNVTSNWELLKKGIDAYNLWIKSKNR